jgi:WD40 repeat protein
MNSVVVEHLGTFIGAWNSDSDFGCACVGNDLVCVSTKSGNALMLMEYRLSREQQVSFQVYQGGIYVDDEVTCLSISGNKLVVGTFGCKIHVFNIDRQTKTCLLLGSVNLDVLPHSIWTHSDDNLLVVGFRDGSLSLINMKSMAIEITHKLGDLPVNLTGLKPSMIIAASSQTWYLDMASGALRLQPKLIQMSDVSFLNSCI